ncbi:MAG TPA: 2-phospho-L-lactate guanylyltransferase [Anaerolineales bacterium]
MSLWAIVPVKPLRRAKSRLAGVLTAEERNTLSRRLLAHTLLVLGRVPQIGRVLVVSQDPKALAVARKMGAKSMTEPAPGELNRALRRASRMAVAQGATGVLVVPADLPMLDSNALEDFLARAEPPPVVIVAPDRRGRGTNTLFVSPPGLIEYEFGPHSFRKHTQRARAAGARLEVCEVASLGLDVDTPEDLDVLTASGIQLEDG